MARRRQDPPDLRQPLPPEPRLNVAFLVEIPLEAAENAIIAALRQEGFDDVRPAHGKVFTFIRGDGSRLTDLAAAAKLTKQAMQYLVDDLERRGYTERIPDPNDRRAKLVRLAPRGRAAVLVGRQAIGDLEQRWAKELGAKRMEQLRMLLGDLVEVVRATDRAGPYPEGHD